MCEVRKLESVMIKTFLARKKIDAVYKILGLDRDRDRDQERSSSPLVPILFEKSGTTLSATADQSWSCSRNGSRSPSRSCFRFRPSSTGLNCPHHLIRTAFRKLGTMFSILFPRSFPILLLILKNLGSGMRPADAEPRVDILYTDVYFFLMRVPAKPYFFLDFRDIFLAKVSANQKNMANEFHFLCKSREIR